MEKRLLDILCCPLTKSPLRLLDATELALVNQSIANGDVVCLDGSPVAGALDGALVTDDGARLYRIDDGVPVLLADQAIDASAWIAAR